VRERERESRRKKERKGERQRKREKEKERGREVNRSVSSMAIAPVAGFENLSPLHRPVCVEVQRKTSPGYIRRALPYFRRLA
jgi:hypothetical protein